MPDKQEVNQIMDLIRQIHIRMSSYYSQAVSNHDLNAQQYTILFVLMHEGPCKMNDLAKRLAVTSPAITNTIDVLEKNGLIRRETYPNDRRVKLVIPTQKAENYIHAIQEKTCTLFHDTITTFDKDTRERIKLFYQTLITNFDRIMSNEN